MTSGILKAFTMSEVDHVDPNKPVPHNTPYVHKEYASSCDNSSGDISSGDSSSGDSSSCRQFILPAVHPADNLSGDNSSGLHLDAFFFNYKYKWLNILIYTAMHLVFFHTLQLHITTSKWQSNVFAWIYGIFGGLGLTAGVHRLWAHKSYKANLPLRILLAISHSISNQQSIYRWVRDHRTHHKYSDTDADPHDPRRGFIFAHIGWLVITKRPAVIEAGKTIDMSDILSDPVASFQTKYNSIIGPFFCFILPTFIPCYFWDEDVKVAFLVCALGKYTITSNINWSINSFAHTLGMRPYDRTKGGTQSKILNVFAFGEGWHNYHHAFPWDYASAELGLEKLNFTKQFIDLFAKIGWAYDRKRVPLDVVKRRVLRIGDGSHHFAKELDEIKYKELEDNQFFERDNKFSVETS